VQDLGIAGFPTLLAERNGQLALLTNGYQPLESLQPCSAAGWSRPPVLDLPGRQTRTGKPCRSLSWAEIRRLALHHKKALWIANGVAVLAACAACRSRCCCRCWWTKCCWAMAMPR
jgi:hypothetical protein